jgi:hypothetical protein
MKFVRKEESPKEQHSTHDLRGRGLEGGLGGFSLGISSIIGSGSLIIDVSSLTRVTASHTALAAGPLNHNVSLGGDLTKAHALQN